MPIKWEEDPLANRNHELSHALQHIVENSFGIMITEVFKKNGKLIKPKYTVHREDIELSPCFSTLQEAKDFAKKEFEKLRDELNKLLE